MFKFLCILILFMEVFLVVSDRGFFMIRYAILQGCMNYEEFKEYDNHQY